MATANMSDFLRRLTRGMAAETIRDQSDRQLVERLRAGRDETVFEAIVRRHGPMVYRVCWRVLQQEQDTEDAFQATFLILAHQVRTVRRPASLASWLHGIARRVALKAGTRGTTRRRHEQKAGTSFPPEEVPWRELRAVLDAELERLPEKWRSPLILCYLEGQTQDEAAKQLGWSQRTLRRRLEEARTALGRRLTRRGVVWPASLSAVLLSDCLAPAALTPRLLASTVDAAAFSAAGKAASAAAVSAHVAALTEGVLQTMFTSRLKIATTALVLVAAFVVGAGALLYTAQAAKALGDASSSAGSGQEVKAPAAKGTGPGRLLLVRNSDFVALNPDGKEEHQWPNHGKTLVQARAQGYRLPGRLSPDGSRAACVVMASEQRKRGDSPEGWRFKVVIRNLGAGEEKAVDFTGRGLWIQCWRPDGKRLVVWHWMDDGQARHILVDPYSGKTEPLDLPAGMLVLDWARDDTFLVSYDNYAKDQQSKSWLGMLEKGSKEARLLTTRARMRNLDARLSPDGKWVLFTDARRSPDGKVLFTDAFAEDRSRQPYILDVLTGKRQPLADFPEHAEAQGVAWSPDGKRVAYTWWQLHPDLLKKWDLLDDNDRARPTEAFLVVADADGRNAKVIASQCTNRISEPTFGSVDWR